MYAGSWENMDQADKISHVVIVSSLSSSFPHQSLPLGLSHLARGETGGFCPVQIWAVPVKAKDAGSGLPTEGYCLCNVIV